ncbi:MAG: hypothetical protein U1B83_09930, partial [Candidatus Cloacimonadaceae bacterium]|nr:hypothetical protein [Candidatus Cloacimonadaceae bacterium]
MRGLFFLGALAVLLLTNACAVMDLSHLQTAVPLGTNHWDFYIYKGIGMNLYPNQDFRDIYDEIAASDT